MSKLFIAAKAINIQEHMERHGRKMQQAGSTFRANPSPGSNHNDCCTVYPGDNSYKCFSCDAAGDVINIERALGRHESNKAAAFALTSQYGIDIDNPKPQAESVSPKAQPVCQKAGKHPGKHGLPPERAAAIRRFAADHFHAALMQNPAALAYQTKKRKHTLDTLKKYQIGLTTPSIIQAYKGAGHPLDDLVAVGLAKKRPNGGGYIPYIANGLYVYPHFIGDRIAHFTIKDPTKENEYQVRRACADADWILYGQDILNDADEIWLVEGEDDRITTIELGGVTNTAATIGDSNTTAILEWIRANGKGKTFYLAFDPDDAGRKYTAKFNTCAYNAGCTVYVVDLTKHNDDIDGVLRASEDPAKTLKALKKSAKQLNLDERGEDSRYKFGSFEILGEMHNGSLAFWSSVHRRTYFIKVKELSLDTLCQIGGWEVRARVSRTAQEGMLPFKSLKTHLICQAGDNYLGNLKVLGQGIHLLRDGRLLIVNGDEATIWDGTTFNPQEYPIIDRQYISGESDLRWIDMKKVQARVREMTPEKAEKVVERLLELVSRWQFSHPMENIMLTGWIIAQVVQSAWEWRPQLWLSGASGSGKTMLTQLVEAIGGNLVCRFEGNILTEPGLRQTLQNHAYCTIIDEFEQSSHRDRIIERLRSAGRGGKGAIGSSKQEAVFSHIRHMIMIASIETGLIRAAEQYRYLQIYTKKDNRVKPSIPASKDLKLLQIDMVAYALWSIFNAKEIVSQMDGGAGYDNRWVHSVSVPFSMIAACDPDPAGTLKGLVADYMAYWSSTQEGGIIEDEAALIQDILLASIRIAETIDDGETSKSIYVERTIGQLLDVAADMCEDHHKTMQAHGIRLTEDDELFIYPETVGKKLLGKTRWKDLNLRDILLRCAGAKRSRQYIAGTRLRGVTIPASTWVN